MPELIFLPPPTGHEELDILRVRRVMVERYRENQPAINQPAQDTLPGPGGSGDA